MSISNAMLKTDLHFCNHHFSTPSFSHSLDGGHTNAILAAKTPAMFFQGLKSLLDKISGLVLSNLGGRNSSSRRIVFHPHIPLPPATSSRPILLGCADDSLSGKTPSAAAIQPVHSLVSCDLKRENREQTITDDASNFLVRRPDIHGFYVLSVDRSGYQFGWADASGVVLSPAVQWTPGDSSDVGNLVTYVHSLYSPPEDHIFLDTTIKPTIGINPNRPRFTIVAGDQSYTDCIQIFGGCVYGRRSAVFASSKQTKGDLVVIKDSFEGASWSTTETKILEQIHEDGFVPGVVSLVHSEQVCINGANENEDRPQPLEVYNTPTKDSSAHHRATKQRIVMGSKGVPLSKARSAKDVLMATYDVLAVHRWIGNRRRIIHRDIAKNNILMYPQHRKDISSAKAVKDPPQVIRNILKGEKCSAGVEDASCLLIDFDGASRLEGNPAADSQSKKDLSQRRGTPMFISRSVCRTEMLRSSSSSPFVPMPQLTGDAKEMYIKTYGQETYEKYLDSGNTFHGRTYTKSSEKDRNHKFTHRLDHDAESTFWLLLCTLIRAQPPNSDDDPRSLRQLAYA
ncbi:hypothetical protein C8Q75DRAFT_807477 [Abortiporus biennis]|nr:hypothetical protein C8Q75DRAFT_807477 [Abortiporus biennis]